MGRIIHIFAYTVGIGLIGAASGVIGASWLIRNNQELRYLVLKDIQYLGPTQPTSRTFDFNRSYVFGTRKDK